MQHTELFWKDTVSPRIDYSLIAKAITFYISKGFKYLEVPWIVPELYNQITFEGPFPFKTHYGVLVGSAEQSFLYMAANGLLAKDKLYLAATPCFRDDSIDNLHQKSFFKVELFILSDEDRSNLLLSLAHEFYRSIGIDTQVSIIDDNQKDLVTKDVELGSYGWRSYNNLVWSYGTGLAEPRTSYVKNL